MTFKNEITPMITLSTRRQDGSGSLLLILGIPFCVVYFLCFIDEGFYDLRWMQEPGNWVVFGLYWLAMILGEFGVSLLLPSTWPTRQKLWLIIGLGIPLGILLMLAFLAIVTGFAF